MLQTLPEVDGSRIGCVGNSGGGTLTAYIAALDSRVTAAVIGCYITTLRRRMENRIESDPSADPEQDLYDFVRKGIDHAGLLAMIAPRPALLCAATQDFFPIEGTRETFAEAKRLYEVAGAGERMGMVEANGRHGMSVPLREAAYAWFERWLLGRSSENGVGAEPATLTRTDLELQVTTDGQVNLELASRPMLPMIWEQAERAGKAPRQTLKALLRLDHAASRFELSRQVSGKGRVVIVCVNGNESAGWETEKAFINLIESHGFGMFTVDPRGVGTLRNKRSVPGASYADALSGTEENIAYNAFLVGKSLVGMRVTDVIAAVTEVSRINPGAEIVACGRADAGILASMAAAVEPRILRLAVESVRLSFRDLFQADGQASNAASLLPGLISSFGDMSDVLKASADRGALVADPVGNLNGEIKGVKVVPGRFSTDPLILLNWLAV